MASYTRIIAILCESKEKEKICCFGDRQHAEAKKKVKVLTHRPKRAETAEVPKLAEGSSASGSDCPDHAQAKGKSTKVHELKVITEKQKAETAEAKGESDEVSKPKVTTK